MFFTDTIFSHSAERSACVCSISGDMRQEKGQGILRSEGCLNFCQAAFSLFFFLFHFIFALEAFKRSVIAAKEYCRADRCAVCYLCIIPLLMYNMAPPHPLPPNSLCPFSLLVGMLPESNRNMPQLRCGLEQPGLRLQCSGRNLAGHPPL